MKDLAQSAQAKGKILRSAQYDTATFVFIVAWVTREYSLNNHLSIFIYYINENMPAQILGSFIHILAINTKAIKKLGGDFMKCKNCHHYNRSNSVELSNELIDITGICNLSGAVKKSKEYCSNGNFLRK